LVGFVTQRADEKMAKINNEVFGFDSPSLRKSEKAEIKTEAFRDNGHYATEDAVIKEILKQK
jgi:hypothetical protein